MKFLKFIVLIFGGSLMLGCESRIDEVQQQMLEIRHQPPLPIDPPPIFEPAPAFSYMTHQLRSPFLPNSLAEELKLMAGRKVYPNFSRLKQPLESYALEALTMKGSLKQQNGQIMALIQTPDQEIEKVQVGNYIGLNYGRITKITPTQIDLIEMMPDGREGYIERSRSLVLIGLMP